MPDEELIRGELLAERTAIMDQFLEHFPESVDEFIARLSEALALWRQYEGAVQGQMGEQPELGRSAWYMFYAIHSTLVAMRLFLMGFTAAAGNHARQSIESVAWGILLCFRETGAFDDLEEGRPVLHKAVARLVKNAKVCGVDEERVAGLQGQMDRFHQYSHPSNHALALTIQTREGWNLGPLFAPKYIDGYRQEANDMINIAVLAQNAILGLHGTLAERGRLPHPEEGF